MLRAKAVYKSGGKDYLRLKEYSVMMTDLEDTQLEFESLKREMELEAAEALFRVARSKKEFRGNGTLSWRYS